MPLSRVLHRILGCVLLIAALPACSLKSYKEDPSAPRSLTIWGGGGLSGSTKYFADGNFVVEERHFVDRGRQKLHIVSKIKLTPEQWRAFWQTVDQSKIPLWKPHYISRIVNLNQCHGDWFLDLRLGSKHYKRDGEEAYPLKKDPTQTVEHYSPSKSSPETANKERDDAFRPLVDLFQSHLAAAKH